MKVVNTQAITSLAIRRPAETVFNAFIDPAITTKFWFTHSTGRLKTDATVYWKWEMYGLEIPVNVLEMIDNKMILIEWGEGNNKSTVKWEFEAVNENLTFLTIQNYNFLGVGAEQINQIKDSTKGFTFVLAGLKSWLEHSIELHLVDDAFPEEMRGNS